MFCFVSNRQNFTILQPEKKIKIDIQKSSIWWYVWDHDNKLSVWQAAFKSWSEYATSENVGKLNYKSKKSVPIT